MLHTIDQKRAGVKAKEDDMSNKLIEYRIFLGLTGHK
jgi:hypothetical protein